MRPGPTKKTQEKTLVEISLPRPIACEKLSQIQLHKTFYKEYK